MRRFKALHAEEVKFIIIGGAAAVLHGSAYVTADLDICSSREKENLEKLVSALAPFHLRYEARRPIFRFSSTPTAGHRKSGHSEFMAFFFKQGLTDFTFRTPA